MDGRTQAIADALRRTSSAAADRYTALAGKRAAIERAAMKALEERARSGSVAE